MRSRRIAVPAVAASAAVLLGFLATSTALGGAQQQVPEELVFALVKNMYQATGMPDPEILVGSIPADLESRLYLPDGARVHGSIVREDGVTVVVSVDLSVEETKAALRREMPALGWTASEAYERIGQQTQQAALIPVLFCNEAYDQASFLVDSRGTTDSSLVRIDHAFDRGEGSGSVCRPRPERQRPEPPPRDLPRGPERVARSGNRLGLSAFRHPPSSPLASGRCLPGRSGTGTGASSTELSGPQLIEHYVAQLQEAGWVRAEPDGTPETYAAAWTLESESGGEPTHALLQVPRFPLLEHCWTIHLSTSWSTGQRR